MKMFNDLVSEMAPYGEIDQADQENYVDDSEFVDFSDDPGGDIANWTPADEGLTYGIGSAPSGPEGTDSVFEPNADMGGEAPTPEEERDYYLNQMITDSEGSKAYQEDVVDQNKEERLNIRRLRQGNTY